MPCSCNNEVDLGEFLALSKIKCSLLLGKNLTFYSKKKEVKYTFYM